MIVIDGSGVYTFDNELYEKTSKSGITSWQQNILEVKIVCSNGFSLSIAAEWLKNEDGCLKQDCEQKVLKRLLGNLKRDFPKLPICILLDGVFTLDPVMALIKDNG